MAKRRAASGKSGGKITVRDVSQAIEARAPTACGEDWDNVGLLAGRSASTVRSAVISIDLTEEAIERAIRRGANLIVNHHPCIFPGGPKSRGLGKVTDSSSPSAALVCRAVENGISILACHTNFDQCALEVIRTVANGLGVIPRGRLLEPGESALVSKLVVFVPRDHVDSVRNAICEAGAGRIGNYDFCSFGSEGIGTFRGNEGSHPYIGKPGRLERAQEVRLETVFPTGLERQVLRAMLDAHPYEEAAYDLYPVRWPSSALGGRPLVNSVVKGLGYGFWGEFKSPKPFAEVAKNVRHLFQLDGFWLTNPASPKAVKKVRKLAFVAGKGSSFLDAAVAAGCDLFITGETGYHVALDGSRKGLAVLELGHRQSERFFLTTMEGWLTELGVRSIVLKDAAQRICR